MFVWLDIGTLIIYFSWKVIDRSTITLMFVIIYKNTGECRHTMRQQAGY